MEKTKITFLESVEVKAHDGEVEKIFVKGKSYTLPLASADRWIRRGKAVLSAGTKKVKK